MSFNNFGKPVASERLVAAERALSEMLPDAPTWTRLRILGFFCERIQRDLPAVLLGPVAPEPINALDLAGRYRLLAALLAEAP